MRKIDPTLSHLTDEELENIQKALYDMGQLIFEDWHEQKFDSKNPIGTLENPNNKNKI